MREGDHVDVLAGGLPWVDYERTEQPALHLDVGDLVGVVPEAPGLVGDEAVGVRPPAVDCVLGDARDAVLGVGHVEAVPVQGDPGRDVRVAQPHLDQLSPRWPR